jgi:regulator of RNase E activity RraB
MNDYYVYRNEEGAAVRTETDLSLIDTVPDNRRPWLVWVFVKIKSPDANGWCIGQECEQLLKLRSSMQKMLGAEIDAVFAGERMQDGWVELFFYAPAAKKFQSSAASVMKDYEGYAFDTGSSRDAKWEHYQLELYPDAVMLQQIESRFIISELEEAGDDITAEREVEHYLFFQTEANAERFAQKMAEKGFALKEKVVQENAEHAHGVVLVKTHAVTEEVLMAQTSELFDEAYREHGTYEGWSTVLAS